MKTGWACMECGHKFKTVAAAKKAAFGDRGCPKCGGADIDLDVEKKVTPAEWEKAKAMARERAAALEALGDLGKLVFLEVK